MLVVEYEYEHEHGKLTASEEADLQGILIRLPWADEVDMAGDSGALNAGERDCGDGDAWRVWRRRMGPEGCTTT